MKSLQLSFFVSNLAFLLIVGLTIDLSAQTLNDDGNTYTINVDNCCTGQYNELGGGQTQDYTIPASTYSNRITFYLRGGDGGYAKAGENCKSEGGEGATVNANFKVGNGTNELKPGGEIRFIVGKHGDDWSVGGSAYIAGGGGGGTAVLYRPNSSSDWVILAVAGGGGGAFQGNVFGGCVDSQRGQGGRASENGSGGAGNNAGSGGTNGNGGGMGTGGQTDASGGGGGAFGSGGGGGSSDGGSVGYYNGGSGGMISANNSDGSGGFGFGGGGSAFGAAGGGGGYSGGGGGGKFDNGGAGGSYVNSTYAISSTKTDGNWGVGNTDHGYVNYSFQTVTNTWTGNVNSSWTNPANWQDNALPGTESYVVIPSGVLNFPSISAAVTLRSLDIRANAELTVTPQGTLSINNAPATGIKVSGLLTSSGWIQINNTLAGALVIMGSGNATAYLYGDTDIGNSGSIGGAGIYVEGTLVVDKDPANNNQIDLDPTVTINNVSGNGISNLNGEILIDETSYGGSEPTVTINIGTTGMVGNIGIANAGDVDLLEGTINIRNTASYGLINTPFGANSGNINVGSDGILSIGASGSSIGNIGLQNDANCNISNTGTIRVRKTVSHGIKNLGSFTNNAAGSIIVNETSTDAILSDAGTFTNRGEIKIGELATVSDSGIRNLATFNNNSGGVINIGSANFQISFRGIDNETSGTFTNAGTVNIRNTDSQGILNSGTFYNNANSNLFVDQTGSAGIDHASGTFINGGIITIGSLVAASSNGIENHAVFDNLAGATIRIPQASLGIFNVDGTFTNEGLLEFGENGNFSSGKAIQNGASGTNVGFLNSSCSAVIYLFDGRILDGGDTFINSGTILQETADASNINANNGVILYRAGSFTVDNGNPPLFISGNWSDKKLWTGCDDSSWTNANNWYPSGIPTASDQVIIYPMANEPVIATATVALGLLVFVEDGATLTNNGRLTVADGNFRIWSGATVQGDGEYFLNRSFLISNGGTFIPGTSTVTMEGNGSHDIRDVPVSFYNLVISKPSGSLVRFNTVVTVTNSLTIISGDLVVNNSLTCPQLYLTNGSDLLNNGSVTTTTGGLYIPFGAGVSGNGQYFLSGSFSVDSGGTFTPGTSTVTMQGTGTSTITSTPSITFYNLTLDKAVNNQVFIFTDVTVSNELTFLSGRLRSYNNDIELTGNGTIIGESATSYFYSLGAGVVKKTVNLNAPSSENPGNIGVTITSSANLGSTTIQRGHEVRDVNGEVSIVRTYDISPTNNSGLDATVRFHYLDHELNGLVENDLTPFRYNGTSWDDYAISTSDATANWVETINVAAFSIWTLAGSSAILPVELTYFSATKRQDDVLLTWQTATETNNEGFDVEHSTDGRQWDYVDFVKGHDNSTVVHDYSFLHPNPSPGVNYYRLRQVDFDGQFEYSNVRSVAFEGEYMEIKVFPNPTSSRSTIQLPYKFEQAFISVFDLSGRTVFEQRLEEGSPSQSIDVSAWLAGMYLVQVQVDGQVFSQKLQVIKN